MAGFGAIHVQHKKVNYSQTEKRVWPYVFKVVVEAMVTAISCLPSFV